MFALSGFHAEGVGGRRGPKPGGSRGVPGREHPGKLFNPWDNPAISSSEFENTAEFFFFSALPVPNLDRMNGNENPRLSSIYDFGAPILDF
jgi:hypothetical protein